MKYALIGCGRIAPNHIKAAAANSLELVAICDIDPAQTAALCEKFSIPDTVLRFTDHKALLAEIKPDLIAIATESGSHAVIAKDCIRAGCNLIIEKPIALSMKDAAEIVSLSEEYGVKVSACHQNRFNIAIQQTRKALLDGRLGKLSHGAITVRWSRSREYYAQADWRGTWACDGGTLMNQCIHGFDLLRWMMGDEIEEVYGVTRNAFHPYIEGEDLGMAVIKFKNGTIATAEGTTNIYTNSLDTETLCLYGDKGAVEIGGTAANKVAVWSFAEESEEDSENRTTAEQTSNVYGNGHTSLYADVIDAIKSGREPYVDARAGMRALELILSIYKSMKTGKPVSLPLEDFSTMDMVGTFDKN